MNQADIDILAGFEGVWQRVMGESVSERKAVGSICTETVINELQELRCGYLSMARQAPMPLRRRLQELARRSKHWICTLQLEYFLKTGDIYVPEMNEKFASCTMSNLRKIWRKASILGENLQTVQEENQSENWGSLCAIREEIQDQAEELKRILSGFFQ